MYAHSDNSGRSSDSDTEIYQMSSTDERSSLIQSPEHGTSNQNPSNDADVNIDSGDSGSTCFTWVLCFFAAIGGFLFGYDTGVISGAMLLLQRNFHLSSIQQEVVVSVTIGLACLSALIGGPVTDRFGRKLCIIFASVIFTTGAIVLAVSVNFTMLVVGRGILGVGIGLASMTVPMYIAECAPPHLRGRLVTVNNLFITGGQFIASLIDGAFSYDKTNGWRYMLGLAAAPSIIQGIGFIFLPESPRWLMRRGRTQAARNVLQKMYGTSNIDNEIKAMEQTVENDNKTDEGLFSYGKHVVLRAFTTPSVRRAMFVGCGLQLFQQLSGINTVMYYSATIIKMSGVTDERLAIWLAAMTAGVNFVFTLVGVWLVERVGRRVLILGSLTGVLLSLIVLAVGFQLAALKSPPITKSFVSNTSCQSYDWCEDCIENTNCGFCYENTEDGVRNSSCLPISENINTQASVGVCNATTLPNGWKWTYEYCPTPYSWAGVLGLVLYLVFFAPGMGPMPWTINSEIYPMWARSTGIALATATNWLSNLVVSMTFLTLTETITKYGTYWLFVGIVLLGIIFIGLVLPETRGKRLEETEELFSHPLCPCQRKSSLMHSPLMNS
ncbi:hypothetical protein ScPMuIL_008160 [Solemya velum]